MRADLKATGVAYLVFLAVYPPVYLGPIIGEPAGAVLSLVTPWLAYIAAFLGGLTVAYRSRIGERLNCLLLAVLIALSLGLTNYFGPSDFPGLNASAWVAGLSFPIALFLVAAGLGAKGFFTRSSEART
ncbi:MAG TPA: hypothetical protein PKN13_10165 [Accumulibacter sp.]|nr:hypothetical protein [Accumulibacter sp.]HNM75686.1 hypothetical protein [Accumulibacter sp.]